MKNQRKAFFSGIGLTSLLMTVALCLPALLYAPDSDAHLIYSSDKRFCLDVKESHAQNWQPILMWRCHTQASQRFIYDTRTRQLKFIKNQGFCVAVNDGADNKLYLRHCDSSTSLQQFSFVKGRMYHDKSLYHDNGGKTPRCAAYTAYQQVVIKPCWGGGAANQQFHIPKVCLYSAVNYQESVSCYAASDEAMYNFNDIASSATVIGGVVSLHEHNSYWGNFVRIDQNTPSLFSVGRNATNLNDKVSSLQVPKRKYYYITSDPQVTCTDNCNVGTADSHNNIRNQYRTFGRSLLAEAVIVNGDITEFGHGNEWRDFHTLTRTLGEQAQGHETPLYYGLGNHDMFNNYNDCAYNNCTIRSMMYLLNHVQGNNRLRSHDAYHWKGWWNGVVQEHLYGSQNHSIDFGDVLMIQLNDYSNDHKVINIDTYVPGWGGLGHQKYVIRRTQDLRYNWLQQQLRAALKKGQIVVINRHRDSNLGPLHQILNNADVRLRFAGHLHYVVDKNPYSGFYRSGSSARGDFLQLAVDVEENRAYIYRLERYGSNRFEWFDLHHFSSNPPCFSSPCAF